MTRFLSLLLLLLAPVAGSFANEGAALSPPGPFHGNWRMVSADDRGDHGLMHLTIQLSVGERTGSADYAAHQPFCSFLAGGAIDGIGPCEIGAGIFDRVERKGATLTLYYAPTADGAAHRITLRRKGERLVGRYRANGLDRAIILEHSPETPAL